MECNIHLRGIYMYRIFVKNPFVSRAIMISSFVGMT